MESLKIKITNVGNKGDPFGKDETGKVVFVKGNSTLKKGDVIECELFHENDNRKIAKFSRIISEGLMQQPDDPERWKKIELLKEQFPVPKVLNSNSRDLLATDTAARNVAHYILDQEEGPATAKYDYPDFRHAFLSLRAAGLVAMVPPDKWCFSGEDFVKVNCKSASIEFVRRYDIRKEVESFLKHLVRNEFERIIRRRR
jgi:hypothetical protein